MRSSEQTWASSTELANSLAKGILPLLCGCALVAIGCGTSPVTPTSARASVEHSISTAAQPSSGLLVGIESASASLTPVELTDRGWTCRVPPVPNRIVCSRPNQGFPTLGTPPPADRPVSFTFLAFDGSGVFIGTQINLRTDIYNGQICESTGQPYIFRALIGYYECLHTAGQ
jgi:hypothetical protein